MAFEGLFENALESVFVKAFLNNSSIAPNPADFVKSQFPGVRVTNEDGSQAYCTTPGVASTCQRVVAPSPKRAPQQTTNVVTANSPVRVDMRPLERGVIQQVGQTGQQVNLDNMVQGHENDYRNATLQPVSSSQSAPNIFGGQFTLGLPQVLPAIPSTNPFAFLFNR